MSGGRASMSKGFGILPSARYSNYGKDKSKKMSNSSKLIVFVIGGLCHQEVQAVAQFERNQIVYGKWKEERIVLGSSQKKVLTGRDMVESLEQVDFDAQAKENGAGFRGRSSVLESHHMKMDDEASGEDQDQLDLEQIRIEE